MKEEVSHRGRVLSVDAEKIRVEIISSSACTSCHAAGLCSMSEAVKKIVDVPAFGNSGYAPGDEVELVLTASMGMKAVLAAYAVPLVICLLSVCQCLMQGCTRFMPDWPDSPEWRSGIWHCIS